MSLMESSNIKKVIGVISGKGGVGKSTVTTMIARQLNAKGYRVGIMDADITGPSIPKMMGISAKATAEGGKFTPVETEDGIKVMSMNLLLDDAEKPVIYRGPLIATIIRQFYKDTLWGELDYLLVDMPPGTGDVPLTVYRELPIEGVVMVTSPQSLVKMIVMKAVNMAERMNVSLLGIVENYSYFICPDCGKQYPVFGESDIDNIAEELGTRVLAKIPLMPEIARAADAGDRAMCDTEISLDTIIGR